MAEEEEDLSVDEAEELAQLLEAEEALSEGDAGPPGSPVERLRLAFKANPKLLYLAGAGVLAFLVGSGFLTYYLLQQSRLQEPPLVIPPKPEEQAEPEPEAPDIAKPNLFEMKPFFVPLRHKGKETGEFLTLETHLLLSNNKLHQEVTKNLVLIRKNIYLILRRKDPAFFRGNRFKVEERLKQEILTSANTLLLSGTGTISDVYFTQFIVK